MMIPDVDYQEKASSMADLIARLPPAVDRVQSALADLSDEECCATPIAGKWSIRQTTEHIVSASLGWTEMFYQALEDVYTTPRTTNSRWTEPLIEESHLSIPSAIAVFRRNNAAVASFLATLPAGDFARGFKPVAFLTEPFQISESVNWGLVIHADYHLATLHKLRHTLGKPLSWMAVYLERYPKP